MKKPLYSQKTSFNKLRILKYTALAVAVFFIFSEAVYAADVTLQWDANTDIHLAYYWVYYDTDHPGPLYRGSGAREGNSPIYVFLHDDENPDPKFVEYTIHDLPDGMYYFAVTAVNDGTPPLESGYSNEASTILTTDTAPPYTVNHDPVSGATGVSVDTLITLEIRDEGVGVDFSTISMWVNGSRVNPTISGDPAAYVLSYNPHEDFAYEQNVSVEVEASDLKGNTMAADFYSFTTTTESDTAPPYTVNHDPVPGATEVSVDTLITLEIRDEGVGVDLSTITMWVNGSRVNPSIIPGHSGVYILSYDPIEDFAYEQSVSVEIDASDLNGNAMMEPDFYTFTTETEPSPLSVSVDERESTGSGGGGGGGGGGCFISTLGQG